MKVEVIYRGTLYVRDWPMSMTMSSHTSSLPLNKVHALYYHKTNGIHFFHLLSNMEASLFQVRHLQVKE